MKMGQDIYGTVVGLHRFAYNRLGGFTLVEMLTASVIGGFVAMVAAGALHAISTGRDKLEDHVSAASELRYVESLIRRDLSNMYRDSDNTKRLLIGTVDEGGDGLSSKIIFYTTRWSPVRVGPKKLSTTALSQQSPLRLMLPNIP